MRALLWFFGSITWLALAASCSDDTATGVTERTGAELIAARGTPTAFSMECSRRAYDATSRSWRHTDQMVRIDSWLYAQGSQTMVVALVNGEVVGSGMVARDLSAIENPDINPRQFGCLEQRATVEGTLGLSSPDVTTTGTDVADVLDFGDYALQGDYYRRGNIGLLLTTLDGERVISMVTL
jgi:hypothetical protein